MIKTLKTTVLAAALAAGCAAAAPALAAVDSLLNFNSLEGLKIYHAYSASDGHTYVEEINLPASPHGPVAQEYLKVKPQQFTIARSKAGALADWHYAGDSRHLIIPMQEDIVFDLGDGKLLHLHPGEAILAEDWTGKGHKSGCWSATKPTCVVLDILLDPNPKAMPLRPPPSEAGK